MPSQVFDSQTATAAVAKSWLPGSKRFLRKVVTEHPSADTDTIEKDSADLLGKELVRVQWRLVRKMKGKVDPKQVSALSQALKNVRETYHLVTGQAKPGVIRETGRSSRQRSQAKPQPLPDDGPQDQGGNVAQ